MTISVERTSSHDFADLAITTHVMQEACNPDGECPVAGKHTIRKVVKYDGKSYGEYPYLDLYFWLSPSARKMWDLE